MKIDRTLWLYSSSAHGSLISIESDEGKAQGASDSAPQMPRDIGVRGNTTSTCSHYAIGNNISEFDTQSRCFRAF